ncbi:caprin-1 isoform X2 [Oncorhynchus kisutch]|uniref:Cell cycle associated protein 1b n=2 Tax=Oncorhynchus kisutch TaxID=8019 RepID=A0A8C7DGW5_ONCKI|nr:caprin-1 isoform X2 [Oncorhynchus kisutch]
MPSAMNGNRTVQSASPDVGSAPGQITLGGGQSSGAQTEAMKQVLGVVDKKVRNMEKKKGKLDDYQSKKNKGERLNQDQLDALTKYQEVTNNLEFARELQKSFLSLGQDIQKAVKKAARREQLQREESEQKRLKTVLELQFLLDRLGEDSVRQELRQGAASVDTPSLLTDTELTALDELYKLVGPEPDQNTRFTDQYEEASQHLMDLLEGKDKAVAGTTYKALKDSLNRVLLSGYFDQAQSHQNGVCEETEEQAVALVEETEEQAVAVVEETEEQAVDPEGEIVEEYIEPIEVEATEFVNRQFILDTTYSDKEQGDEWTTETEVVRTILQLPVQSAPPPITTEAQSLNRATPPGTPPADSVVRKQEVQNLLSQMQGPYNFMQDSMLEFDGQLIDPAIVSAQPIDPAIVSAQPIDPAIVSAQPIDPAIVSAQPIDPAIVSAQLINPAIVSAQPIDPAIVSAQLIDLAIVSAQPIDPAIVSAQLIDPAIVSAQPIDPAIVSAQLINPAIVSAQLINPAIVSAQPIDPAIVSAQPIDPAIVSAQPMKPPTQNIDLPQMGCPPAHPESCLSPHTVSVQPEPTQVPMVSPTPEVYSTPPPMFHSSHTAESRPQTDSIDTIQVSLSSEQPPASSSQTQEVFQSVNGPKPPHSSGINVNAAPFQSMQTVFNLNAPVPPANETEALTQASQYQNSYSQQGFSSQSQQTEMQTEQLQSVVSAFHSQDLSLPSQDLSHGQQLSQQGTGFGPGASHQAQSFYNSRGMTRGGPRNANGYRGCDSYRSTFTNTPNSGYQQAQFNTPRDYSNGGNYQRGDGYNQVDREMLNQNYKRGAGQGSRGVSRGGNAQAIRS